MSEGSNVKTALITGCSSGIGKELAKEFKTRGWEVFAGARRVEMMDDLAKLGINVIGLDVTDQESVDAAKLLVEEKANGKLDLLFNNAGQSCTFPAADLAIEDAQKCYDVNVFGVMRMVRTFLPMLIAAKGTIANTGSITSMLQVPFSTVYSSSKAALTQYANGLRLELAPFGVKVVTTLTAAVKTDIADTRGLPEGSLYAAVEDGVAERRSFAANNNPMSADVYAKRVVDQLVKKSPKPFFWEGNNWFKIWFALTFLPRRLVDYILMRRFKLLELLSRIAQSKKQT
jgi:1-acylglycerone phosphate reductase